MRKTNFVLTEAQETELVDFLIQRETTLRTDNAERMKADADAWLLWDNDNRRRQVKGTIFELSNVQLPVTVGICEYFLSRFEDELADTGPFLNFRPAGIKDIDLAKQYKHYFNWKVDTQGKASVVMRDTLLPAILQRAAFLKATHMVDTRRWIDRDRNILMDKTTGQPVLVPGRGPVIEGEDEFISLPDPTAVPDAASAGPAGQPPVVKGRWHLKADPSVVWNPAIHEFKPPAAGLDREEVCFRGPKVVPVEYDRILIPSSAASANEADIIIESDDKDFAWFESMWVDRPWNTWESVRANFANGDANLKTTGGKKADDKENLGFDTKNPKRKVLECWVRRDILGWGPKGPQEFVAFLDVESKKLIYYEWQAKVCPDFNRPYTIISVGKSKNRWWGKSLPEKISQYQDEIDRQHNGELYRNRQNATPLKGIDKTATEEEEENLVFDVNKVYNLKKGRKMVDFVSFAELPDLDMKTSELAALEMDMVRQWLGVSRVGQGDYQALPDNPTATGIETAEQSSALVSRRMNRRIIKGFEECATKLVQLAMATMPDNAEETFEFEEGDDKITGTMTAKLIRGLIVNVEVVINKRFSKKKAENAKQALDVQARYLETPDALKPIVRPLLLEILESLEYTDAERLLPLPTPVMPTVAAASSAEPMPPAEPVAAPAAPGPFPAAQGGA